MTCPRGDTDVVSDRRLAPAQFAPLFAKSDAALARNGIVTVYADNDDYPCRISLAGAARGDRLLLLNFEHQPALSPYRSAHAIYVASGSRAAAQFVDTIPPVIAARLLSIRAFDTTGMMVDADVIDGTRAVDLIERQFADPRAAYLHIHFAKRGCFAARVTRAN